MNAGVRKLSWRISKACRIGRRASDRSAGAPVQPRIMATRQSGGGYGVLRQGAQERLDPFRVEREVRRELPQQRPELRSQKQQAGGEEVRQRHLGVAQFQHVGDVAGRFHREHKIGRGARRPVGKVFRPLQAVEGAVDLDAAETGWRRSPVPSRAAGRAGRTRRARAGNSSRRCRCAPCRAGGAGASFRHGRCVLSCKRHRSRPSPRQGRRAPAAGRDAPAGSPQRRERRHLQTLISRHVAVCRREA